MERLNKSFVVTRSSDLDPGKFITRVMPEKVLQFGEGGFLRGFADWMIHRMNAQGIFNGRVVVVQPIEQGTVSVLMEQDCLYTQLLRGLKNGEVREDREVISSISRGINPYADFAAFLGCAGNPDLKIIVSNTTEAGIAYRAGESLRDEPPASFPGKVTRFLYERYRLFGSDMSKGFIIIPCELIDRNGDTLKRIVVTLAEEWGTRPGFQKWIEGANVFCNTLVDGIMTGYPKEEIGDLQVKAGYEDRLYNTGELFRLWVIEGPEIVKKEFPLHEAGLDVVWTKDMSPYRTRKVRILNGAHTMTVLGAFLAGKDTVEECLEDPIVSAYMRRGVFDEIIPVLTLERKELESFAEEVLERFANPFIKHYLLSIALNSAAKYKARVLPTILDYIDKFGKAPEALSWSLAALIAFYRGNEIRDKALLGTRNGGEYQIKDDEDVLLFFRDLWSGPEAEDPAAISRRVLSSRRLWDEDLTERPGLQEAVTRHLSAILTQGPLPSMAAAGS
jgi:tagaturonate reductase